MKKLLFLFSALIMSTMMWADVVTMSYSGSTTGNMTGGNDAATVGLDASSWSVVGDKGGNNNFPGLNKAGQIRLYGSSTNHNTITVTNLDEDNISSIKVTYGTSNYNAKVTVDDAEVTGTGSDAEKTYAINSTSFTIAHNYSANTQVYILSIEITTSDTPTPQKEIVSLEIGGTATKLEYFVGDAFDPAGLTVTATYNDESSDDVTSKAELTIEPKTFAEASVSASVTVTAKIGEIVSEPVTVNNIVVTEKPAPKYVPIAWNEIKDGGKYFITADNKGEYYFAAKTFATGKATAIAFDASLVTEADMWVFTMNGDTWKISTTDGAGLYMTNTNNGLACAANKGAEFTVAQGSSAEFTDLTASDGENTRYVALYNTQDFRCYKTSGSSGIRDLKLYGLKETPTPVEKFDTLYLNTGGSGLWNQGDAKFTVWYWAKDVAGKFTDYLAPIEGNADIYRAVIPQGMEKVIFVRMKNDAPTTPAWGESNANVWNQTTDLDIPTKENNCYTITGWGQGEGAKSEGTWSKYVPAEPKFYVTGNEALVGKDKAWKADAIELVDGVHIFKELGKGEYQLKVTDGTWNKSWGYSNLSKTVAIEGLYEGKDEKGQGNGNIGFTVYKPNDVTVSFKEGYVTVTGDFKAPVITYKDTAYYVAGNFTNWAADMKALPYEVELPADSALEFKQVMTRTILSDGDSIGKDTTWYGQANEGFYMTRESSAWTLDGGYNVLTVTDIAGKYVFSRNDKGEFVMTWPKEPVITYKDSVYYVAGNFTNWAADMKALPYEVELPADSALEFKQVMTRTILSDGDSIGKDTTWYGQANEGFYMTRESSTWTLNGGFNVLAVTDIAGKYVFSMNEKGEFVMTWPKEPVITYKDSVYYVAGNFTNWAADMKALPYEVELPADSALEFKQVMLRTILSDGDSIGQDTTWYGQENEGFYMTRENSAWTLDGGFNVLAVTDIAGKYVFSMNEKGEFVMTWPKEPVITYKDSVYYVAGNFTNWATEMKALPYEVELPADSALEFKQVMLRTILSDGDSIGQDTTWYGQANEGAKMTRESSAWTLNGGFNVLAVTDIAGKYVFSMNEKGEFVMTWPKEPVITYKDSVYYVAGNFTNWAADMKALPYEVELPADSALEFKQIMLRTILSDGDSIGQDTTWYGQENEGFYMTRGNSEWILDGEHNVLAKTDIKGKYVFSMNEKGEFVMTWPEIPVKYYAKNNWNGAAADKWSWLEMSATNIDNVYMLDSVVFGGTGVNINDKADDANALFFGINEITVLDSQLDGIPLPYIPEPRKHDTVLYAPRRTGEVLVAPTLQAGDTIKLFFNATDSTLSATIIGSPEPAAREEFVFVAGDAAEANPTMFAITWGKDGSGETVKMVKKDKEAVYTADILETVDSVVLVRCATDATEIIWEGEGQNVWNQTDNYELCDTMYFDAWVDGSNRFTITCEAPQPICEGQFGILVNDEYIAASRNEAREDVVEYMLIDVELKANDLVQIYDKCNEVPWIITDYMKDSYQFHVTPENKYIIQDGEADYYSFYIQIGPDKLFVQKGHTPTGMNEIESSMNIQKIVRDGHLYILMNDQIYNVQGIRVQ